MQDFKSILRYIIEGEMNTNHKDSLPNDPEEHWNLIRNFLDGAYVPKTAIEARNITKWANENNIGRDRLMELHDRLIGGRHNIKSKTHTTEAMVGLAQNAHRDDPDYAHHKEGLIAQGGAIKNNAEMEIPLKVRSFLTGEKAKYKSKGDKESQPSREVSAPTQQFAIQKSKPQIKDFDPSTLEITTSNPDKQTTLLHAQVKGKNETKTHIGTIKSQYKSWGDVKPTIIAAYHPRGSSTDQDGAYSEHADLVSAMRAIIDAHKNKGVQPTGMQYATGTNVQHGDEVQFRPEDENITGTVVSSHHHPTGGKLLKIHTSDGISYVPASMVLPREEHRSEASLSQTRG